MNKRLWRIYTRMKYGRLVLYIIPLKIWESNYIPSRASKRVSNKLDFAQLIRKECSWTDTLRATSLYIHVCRIIRGYLCITCAPWISMQYGTILYMYIVRRFRYCIGMLYTVLHHHSLTWMFFPLVYIHVHVLAGRHAHLMLV